MPGGMPTFRIIGPGRAGGSVARALTAAGWDAADALGRGDDVRGSAAGVDVVFVTTPDSAIAAVAAAVDPVPSTAVVHMAGSLGLDVLAPHARRAVVHPLVSLPTVDAGAGRLQGAWFAVTGDAVAREVVDALDGRAVQVADDDRAAYHAAAAIASNHVVAVLAQAERVAALAGVPFAAYFDLVRGAVDDVEALGGPAALTGPAARGDVDTVARHVAALPPAERRLYEVLAAECRRLAGWT
jgi:predicted short-subunit dehydrogenase-like oxidoreductase (DUF2520 family)